MPYEVLKPFTYSADGVTSLEAKVGDNPDLPAGLVAGLVGEGCVRIVEAKAIPKAPRNKVIDKAPETKAITSGADEP